jgi:hypothetical protein
MDKIAVSQKASQLEDEDTLHFLIKCNALYAYRKESMKELKDTISDIDESVWRILSNDFNLLLEPEILIRRNLVVLVFQLTERTGCIYFMLVKFATIALEYICTC